MELNESERQGLWLGRVWRPGIGPAVVTLRDGQLVDITSKTAPTVRDVLDMDDPAGHVRSAPGDPLGPPEDFDGPTATPDGPHLLAPCDLQAIKACGVTFAQSMVERVIEEQAAGDPAKADEIRKRVSESIGDSLDQIEAGSEQAAKVKQELIALGMWSQYLEVGIGPDAEVFSKAQTLSAVGTGAEVGLHPISKWNNPEPEIVLAVNARGTIQGATLGNDVNLRDVEGRSALLLSKAKDNNASCAIGPMIRLFDDGFTLDDVRNAWLTLRVEGTDGYTLDGRSDMSKISRDPADLVCQTIGRHHQYPDGFMLFLGTLFAPTEDRDEPGQGFTHHIGDRVTIACDGLGRLTNTVRLSTDCPEWTFGLAALMRNLAGRNLL
ncbi:fumarylacetoacetate hydrolase family protein [Psychromarinibacter sp. C21-152]|uniref:Fumarylacetoacetate hydrolase family protein n=1 Tax=Psychromarinibacter sediminicola TaxID=3033385 RepID=A0AAE3TAG7_9RHOB|nr:fumarylacetoacetate hydrolase family protein [Psychromarinibacter sediminicola]MDF0601974.1 fumarylacetoacetate hydrolase family protein [Psychromarinibacter sediminicola]